LILTIQVYRTPGEKKIAFTKRDPSSIKGKFESKEKGGNPTYLKGVGVKKKTLNWGRWLHPIAGEKEEVKTPKTRKDLHKGGNLCHNT